MSSPPHQPKDREEYIGNISYENHNLSCSFPSPESISPYFEDFEGFMAEIKKELAPQKKSSDNIFPLLSLFLGNNSMKTYE